MKKLYSLPFIFVVLLLSSCVSLKDAEITKYEDISSYKYIIVNSTDTLNSSVGATVYGGGYYSTGKSVNPKRCDKRVFNKRLCSIIILLYIFY